MHVKVPVGGGCGGCPNKMSCNFTGPERAYRTFRIPVEEGCRVGDRVLVHVPGAVLGLTGLVLLGLPVVLLLGGYALLECCVRFPTATLLLWVAGIVIWLAAMYGTNKWIERGAQFRERIEKVPTRSSHRKRLE